MIVTVYLPSHIVLNPGILNITSKNKNKKTYKTRYNMLQGPTIISRAFCETIRMTFVVCVCVCMCVCVCPGHIT